jgi:electron transport complex protein RnfC
VGQTAHNLANMPPRRPPVLEAVSGAKRLLVPIPSDRVHALRSGRVSRGQRLLSTPPGGAFDPLAPASGTIEGPVAGTLTGGAGTMAAQLIVDPETDQGAPDQPVAELPAGQASPSTPALPPPTPAGLGLWIDMIRDAGIWAARAGSPDLALQLQVALARPIDNIICNVLDSDPTLPLQAAVAAAHPQLVSLGLYLLSRLTGAGQVLLAIDQSLPAEYHQPLQSFAGTPISSSGPRLMPIANDYPQPDPTLLLYSLLGRRLRPGRLPAEQGALVLDAAAAVAIGALADRIAGGADGAPKADAVSPPFAPPAQGTREFTSSFLRVPVGVRDHANADSYFLTVPVGMTVGDLFDRVGLYVGQSVIVRGGDLLRDHVLPDDAIIAGGELTLHVVPSQAAVNPGPCVRCGWCFEACPTRVQPAVVLEAAQIDSQSLARKAGIEACIECGVCSYVCPSELPILAGIRHIRGRHSGG